MNSLHDRFNALIADIEKLQSDYERERCHHHETERSNRKKLGPKEVGLIRELSANGWTNRELADAFMVNPATVSRTVRGVYHA